MVKHFHFTHQGDLKAFGLETSHPGIRGGDLAHELLTSESFGIFKLDTFAPTGRNENIDCSPYLTHSGYVTKDAKSHSDQLWKFDRFGYIKEYNDRPALPPPFIVFSHLYIILKCAICRRPQWGYTALRRVLDQGQESSLLSWESYMKDHYQHKQQQRKQESQENLMKGTAESASVVLRLLQMEKGGEGHQLAGRLAVLEAQMDYLTGIISTLTENGSTSKDQILEPEGFYVQGRPQGGTARTAVLDPDREGTCCCSCHRHGRDIKK
ncbi:transient receptor potential cation channel subfamily M member 2-like [Pseudophryne corroboree]|uniref:transient receptor potential cation channel subfamily M member 2-like n=1 Tax=Pseudophryne corroboree TaxID=495146 RepID=UPI0030812C05